LWDKMGFEVRGGCSGIRRTSDLRSSAIPQRAERNSCETSRIAIGGRMFSDTHPKIRALQIEWIRRMPPWKKFAIVDSLNETVRTLAISGIRQRHPQATPEEVRRMLAEMLLGAELAAKVYGRAR
jgi:hypothetical protein